MLSDFCTRVEDILLSKHNISMNYMYLIFSSLKRFMLHFSSCVLITLKVLRSRPQVYI